MRLLGRLLCRLGLHDVKEIIDANRRAGQACWRDGCDWLVMRKGGRR